MKVYCTICGYAEKIPGKQARKRGQSLYDKCPECRWDIRNKRREMRFGDMYWWAIILKIIVFILLFPLGLFLALPSPPANTLFSIIGLCMMTLAILSLQRARCLAKKPKHSDDALREMQTFDLQRPARRYIELTVDSAAKKSSNDFDIKEVRDLIKLLLEAHDFKIDRREFGYNIAARRNGEYIHIHLLEGVVFIYSWFGADNFLEEMKKAAAKMMRHQTENDIDNELEKSRFFLNAHEFRFIIARGPWFDGVSQALPLLAQIRNTINWSYS